MTTRPRRRLVWPTAVGLFVWVPAALTSMVFLGIWLYETFFRFVYSDAVAARERAMPWLVAGLALSLAVFVAGWILSRRWWGALLAVTPGVLIAVSELASDYRVIPQLLFPIGVIAAVVGIVFVVRQADAVMPPLDVETDG